MKIDVKQILNNIYEHVMAFFYPPQCCACGEDVRAGQLICEPCLDELERHRVKNSRTLKYKGRQYTLNSIYRYSYDNVASSIVKRVKYMNKLNGTRFIGSVLAQKASRLSAEYDVVTYVPMTRINELKRGYNQGDYISAALAKQLKLPQRMLLIKRFNTVDQHRLTASKRRENLNGAFKVRGNVKDKRILIIDDVITTGTTLCECADTLYRAGARSVTLLSFSMVRMGH